MSLAKGIIAMGLSMMADMEARNEQWKDEILQKWEDSKKLPRKKKKQRRKELLLDWSIASWSPFQDYNL